MNGRVLRNILSALKNSIRTNNGGATRRIDQVLSKAIVTSLINETPVWNCIIRAYSKTLTPSAAIFVYTHFLKSNSVSPDHHTYPALITACSRLHSLLSTGRELHARVVITGFNDDIYVQNSLIHLYGFAAQKSDARKVFDVMPRRDLTSWNCLIAAHNHSDSFLDGLKILRKMKLSGIHVDAITLMIIQTACGQEGEKKTGDMVHGLAMKTGLSSDPRLQNSSVGMYVKCGEMGSAQKLFDEITARTGVILWNTLIHGYVQFNLPEEAIKLFKKMQEDPNSIEADETTMVSLLAACSSSLNLKYGRQVHSFILRKNITFDSFVETALIDMYSKCGALERALIIFHESKPKSKDVYTWTTMIQGLANNGHAHESLELLTKMENQGIKPNEATFVSALAACGKSGLVEQGCEIFKKMVGIYGIKPKVEHLGCLIHLLSSCGKIEMAMEFIEMIPEEERMVAYKSLLSSCMDDYKIDLGLKFVDEISKIGSTSHAIFVMLSNFHALAGKWSRVVETRRSMKSLDIVKEPGISSISG